MYLTECVCVCVCESVCVCVCECFLTCVHAAPLSVEAVCVVRAVRWLCPRLLVSGFAQLIVNVRLSLHDKTLTL